MCQTWRCDKTLGQNIASKSLLSLAFLYSVSKQQEILKCWPDPLVTISRRDVLCSPSHWSLAHVGQAMTSVYISSFGQSFRGTREVVVDLQSTRPDKRSVHGGLLFCMICRNSSSIGDLRCVSGIRWGKRGLGFALRRVAVERYWF